MIDSLRKRCWHRQSCEEGHKTLCEMAATYEPRFSKRASEATRLMGLYEGRTVTGFGQRGMAENTSDDAIFDGEPVDITLNLAQSLVDTLDAKIAGLENTKPQIVTVEAKWDVRRQALLAGRLLEGQYLERQGRFQDLWDVFRFALRLALASTRTAAVKFMSNPKAGKIQAEVHDTLSMWVDQTAAVYDAPSGMGHVTYWDPERLVETYQDEVRGTYPDFEADVFKAAAPRGKTLGLEALNDDQDRRLRQDEVRVAVTEGWRFASPGGAKGVQCVAFKGGQRHLVWRPYEYEDGPFVMVGGMRSLTSYWHRTLIKPIVAPILRANEILSSIDRSERLTPKGLIFYDPEEITRELLAVGDDHECIPIPGLSGMKGKPIYEAPAPFHPLALELVRFYIEQVYTLPGISELHAAGDTKGEWSGAALRIRKALINERFSTIQRAYVHASTVEASRQIIRCAKEMQKEKPDFAINWRGAGFMKQIDAKVLSVLDKYAYDVQIYPVSESKDTPESELALNQELLEGGIVDGASRLETLRWFDAQQAAKTNTDAQERLISIQIDKWLMAEPSEMRGRRFYRGPVRSMLIPAAIVQVNRAYLNAQADEVEERRIGFFKRYLNDLMKISLAAQTEQAGLMAQAGGTAAAAGQLGGQPQPPMAAPPGAMAA